MTQLLIANECIQPKYVFALCFYDVGTYNNLSETAHDIQNTTTAKRYGKTHKPNAEIPILSA
ncbi:MAG: hypothetical protein ACOX45_01500 [Acutalibacteraceae bacterium]